MALLQLLFPYAVLFALLYFAVLSLRPRQSVTLEHYVPDPSVSFAGRITLPERNVEGKVVFDDDSLFNGTIRDGHLDGTGTLTFPEGDTLQGQFVDGTLKEATVMIRNEGTYRREQDGTWMRVDAGAPLQESAGKAEDEEKVIEQEKTAAGEEE